MVELISSGSLRLMFSMAWLTIFSAAYGLASSTAAYGSLGRRLRGLIICLILNVVKQTGAKLLDGRLKPRRCWQVDRAVEAARPAG